MSDREDKIFWTAFILGMLLGATLAFTALVFMKMTVF